MRKPQIGMPRLFIVLSLALAGLMTLQVLLLRYAWDLKVQALESGARTALASAVLALQSREIEGSAYDYFFAQGDSTLHGPGTVWTTFGSTTHDHPEIREESAAPAPVPGRSDDLHSVTTVESARRFRTLRRDIRRLEGRKGSEFGGLERDSLVVVVAPDAGPGSELVAFRTGTDLTLRHVVGEWINRAPLPISERLDAGQIAGVLRDELVALGIGAEPAFGVIRPRGLHRTLGRDGSVAGSNGGGNGADVILASDNITDAELHASPYRQQLFPLDPFGTPFELVLAFPGDRLYLLTQIGPLWLASVLFISVIIFSFVKAWRTNAEQRRFGDQLVDFINNMTHEFKTPISTVALAGEAIARDDVQGQPEVLERYVGMIRDENARMHRQVEKILQMARFERGDIELKREEVDVHEVLAAVADSFALQVERRGGRLVLALDAPASFVQGDRVHLESIFGNLVDNAVKYALGAPEVRLTTSVRNGWLEIKVSDRGPGIPRDDQRRIFEKYYRCPTGDRHDVKGFGLGLSFVQSLVRAHGGHVELHSLTGRGTTVTISLPPGAAAGEEST